MPKESGAEAVASQELLYERLAQEYGAALSRLAAAYEANPDQRLLQDIHLAIWRSLPVFNHQCSIRTWIYRVGHNTAYAHIARYHGAT